MLLKSVDNRIIALDVEMVGTVLIDLSKVFNTIDHTLLLNKLNAYCVLGVELAWFTDNLEERKQGMVIDAVTSDWNQVTKGVPQGSILEPLLFVVFWKDLPSFVRKWSVNLYADNTTIYASNEDQSLVGKYLEKT